jgi:hypothetical protein
MKPGVYRTISVPAKTLADLHYLKAKLTDKSFNRKSAKAKRVKITGIPGLVQHLVESYLRRFKGKGLPF